MKLTLASVRKVSVALLAFSFIVLSTQQPAVATLKTDDSSLHKWLSLNLSLDKVSQTTNNKSAPISTGFEEKPLWNMKVAGCGECH